MQIDKNGVQHNRSGFKHLADDTFLFVATGKFEDCFLMHMDNQGNILGQKHYDQMYTIVVPADGDNSIELLSFESEKLTHIVFNDALEEVSRETLPFPKDFVYTPYRLASETFLLTGGAARNMINDLYQSIMKVDLSKGTSEILDLSHHYDFTPNFSCAPTSSVSEFICAHGVLDFSRKGTDDARRGVAVDLITIQ